MDTDPPELHSERRHGPQERRERRGRKPVIIEPAKLAIWLPGELYDRVIHHATTHGLTVAAAARELLVAGLNSDSQKAQSAA